MNNKKILITGSTGFIGANLLHRLVHSSNDIHIILRKTSNIWRISDIIDKVNKHFCDLTDRKSTKKLVSKINPQIIFHLAIYGGYPFQREFIKIITTNFIGTVNLLDACVEAGFECFVNTGSSSEYGIKNKPMSESNLLEPINDYGVAKAAATLYCQTVGRRESLPIFTLRLFSPYGYYEEPTRLIPYLIAACLKKKDLKLTNPYAVRDFNFIEDVIGAYIKTVNQKENILPGDIFNVGNGEQRSVQEIFKLVKKLTGYRKEPHWGKVKIRDSDKARIWIADNSKIKKIIGWKPQYTIENGLRKTIDWFKEYLNLYV
ncbi:GDP-mannose 4,6-dehydratase [Patescibacteria group bacterium]|nr:GDP-mannose 4,6-dehydratase [Patescibacteria group bacterium]